MRRFCSSRRAGAFGADDGKTQPTEGRAEARKFCLILVPSLRITTDYSCRCQAKTDVFVVVVEATATFFESLLLLRDIEHWCRQTCSLYSNFGAVPWTQFKVAPVYCNFYPTELAKTTEALKRFTFRVTGRLLHSCEENPSGPISSILSRKWQEDRSSGISAQRVLQEVEAMSFIYLL